MLGSYHAFGHAVNDDDTYPRQLEGILNKLEINDITFEVWNGGRQSASAIVGLARLKKEIINYRPDLIIWDYGFVDHMILDDGAFPASFLFPDSGIYRPINLLFQLTKNIVAGKSALFSKLMDYLIKKNYRRNVDNFIKVCLRMIQITKENNIPVIILRQSIIDSYIYRRLQRISIHSRLRLVNGDEIFIKYPPSDELIKEFYSGENWLSEYDPALGKERKWQPPAYFKDILQYNKHGHEAIAKYLADEISIWIKESFLKNQQYK